MANKLIHITDLYHPHADPDDHYDLAQVFGLAKLGELEVLQVLIDHPYEKRKDFGSPDVGAVYQMNRLAKANVHVTLGADTVKYVGRPKLWKDAPKHEVWAAEKIIEILKNSDEKVYINIAGGCLDTAIALERAPEVFREKCAGIALNAGSMEHYRKQLEWNVFLGPLEYSRIFQAPCPVYWCPCVSSMRSMDMETWRGAHATYYRFRQKEVFAEVSDEVENFFLFMLNRDKDADYFGALQRTPDQESVQRFGEQYRQMWCTGAIFDIARLAVTQDGEIVPKGKREDVVFSYRPIQITCTEDGATAWEFAETSQDRFLCCIDEKHYEKAMTKALITVLKAFRNHW